MCFFNRECSCPHAHADDTYTVKIVCGDPSYSDSNFHILAEGTTVVQGDADGTGTHWFEGTAQVIVADGRLTLTNGAGSYRNKICFIEITGSGTTFPGQRYENWADEHFAGGLSHPGAAPTEDPDGDGFNNELEWALGSNPNVANVSHDLYGLVSPVAVENPQFKFYRVADFIDVSYSVWESEDMKTWTLVWSSNADYDFTSSVATTLNVNQDGWVTVNLSSQNSAIRRFVRLQVDSH